MDPLFEVLTNKLRVDFSVIQTRNVSVEAKSKRISIITSYRRQFISTLSVVERYSILFLSLWLRGVPIIFQARGMI